MFIYYHFQVYIVLSSHATCFRTWYPSEIFKIGIIMDAWIMHCAMESQQIRRYKITRMFWFHLLGLLWYMQSSLVQMPLWGTWLQLQHKFISRKWHRDYHRILLQKLINTACRNIWWNWCSFFPLTSLSLLLSPSILN